MTDDTLPIIIEPMTRDASGLEQTTDKHRAENLYLLAEQKYYQSSEGSPDDATLLLAMATALLAKQMAKRSN